MKTISIFLSLSLIFHFSAFPLHAAKKATPRSVTTRGALQPDEQSYISLFRESKKSVVYITSLVYRQDFFSFNVLEIPQGTGSGFIWDDKGHIVTNYHVIRNAENVDVTMFDQSTWKAKLVGAAPDKDLAVLKIDAPQKKMRPIPLGMSMSLQVGQKVLAIGNPFGLDYTLTTGIISALGREIQSVTRRPIQGVIQTDAAINPGNSGGPLLDSAGRCIGVNTAIFSPSGAYAGVGFAVPIDTVNQIVPQLIAYGKVIRPGFGIQIADDALARQLGIKGVLVIDVPINSAAFQAGFRPTKRDQLGNVEWGDIIVGVQGKEVETGNDLFRILDNYDVGDKLSVKVRRGRQFKTLNIRLQAIN